ncbi:hypothetical protein SAMN05428964_101593 [Thalassospira xiamenensis]|uniref:Uncharacterized protein n=1 Tax=Thalassospira xiamenensis TaxID=220697 RepID=A0A285RFG8_9PROT|nr:hypothetical protein SAMN05428964_101593 [Thalassospira xiamenensis]
MKEKHLINKKCLPISDMGSRWDGFRPDKRVQAAL